MEFWKAFSSDIPLWVELSNYKCFFEYFKDKFESEDVMLIWDLLMSHLILIKLKNFVQIKNGDALLGEM